MNALSGLDISAALAEVKTICTVEILGELEADDVAAALQRKASSPAAAIPAVTTESGDPKDLKKLRARHHSVARLIASGMQQSIVASLTGYTDSYLSVLLDTPAMQELVSIYQIQYGSQHAILAERLRRVGDMALEEVEDRLADDSKRQELDVHELLAAAKLGLDRSGHGPSSSQHIVEERHIFDHQELRRRDREARNASAERIVAHPQLPAPQKEPDDGQDS